MENTLLSQLQGYWTVEAMGPNLSICLNVIGAMLLGLVVGYERSYRGRAAGMRTYGLVCMASCALVVLCGSPDHWFGGRPPLMGADPTRVIQGIVTGIGFLGAGVIMRDGLNISGLTTAASIWTVSAIGILVGVGYYAGAITLAAASTIFMIWGSKIEGLLPARHAVAVTLHFKKDLNMTEGELNKLLRGQGYELAKGSFSVGFRDNRHEWRFVAVSLGRRKGSTLINLSDGLRKIPGVQDFFVAHARN